MAAAIDLNPQFGAELKDGFRPANAWVGHNIDYLNDVQQFYRDRSYIEKDYAEKLAQLAKKYFEKKGKRSAQLSVGDSPQSTPGSLESASMTTWGVQLTALEQRAAEHKKFSEDLVTSLAEPLKSLHGRCEELRTQHAEYALKLEKERDSSYADLKKTKTKYDAECSELEGKRKKADASMDTSKSKAQTAYSQQMADMHNSKNTYLISINVTNAQKAKYYHEYVPELLDSLQDLSESRVARLNSIWTAAAMIEIATLNRSTEYITHLQKEIPRNNPALDSMMYIRHNSAPWSEPADFAFEASPVWHDDAGMITSEMSKVFLRNILTKSKTLQGEFRRESDRKRREVESLKATKRAIREGRQKADENETARQLFSQLQELHDVERKKISAEVETTTITKAVGDISLGASAHSFKAQTFKIPTNCDLCGERIWGLSAKGFLCGDCGFTCHSKCEMKVPQDCPGEQTKEEKKKLKGERQEAAAHSATHIEELVPERTASGTMPQLQRQDTVNSMNTLSSGYAASADRRVSGAPSTMDGDEPAKPAARAPPGARKMAPPPTAYISGSNGAASEPKAKMLYAFTASSDGELSVAEGKDVVILEPDDGSGWLKVRSGRDEGLVPTAYTEPLSSHAPSASASSHPYTARADSDTDRRPGSTYSASSVSLAGSTGNGAPSSLAAGLGSILGGKKKGPAVAPRRGAKKLKHAEALYAYEARSEAEHSIAEGERFVLVSMDAGDGWADVEKGGVTRSVPANYIKEV